MYRVPFIFLAFSFALAACSTHPLPQDVTGLPISEIVHRIQCEGADIIKEMQAKRSLVQRSYELEALDKELGGATKTLRKMLDTLRSTATTGRPRSKLKMRSIPSTRRSIRCSKS